MQNVKVPYNPALDDGGGEPGAKPQRYIPGEIGNDSYADRFESDNNHFAPILPHRQPPQLYMPQIPSGNPIPSFVPLQTQVPQNTTDFASYHYLRSHSSSLTQPNFSDRIHPSNDNFHSQPTAVTIQRNNYHPVFSICHTCGVGSNGDSVRPRLTFTGYNNDHTSISPPQGEYFDVGDKNMLERAQFYVPPPQNDVGDPEARNTHDLAVSQGLWSYVSPHRLMPGPPVAALNPNAPVLTHSNTEKNATWFGAHHPTQPQAIDMGFTMPPPELQVHYASPPCLRRDQPPPLFTEEPFFNSSQFYSPPTYGEGSPPHQGIFGNHAPGGIFDPAGVGTAYQGAHLYGYTEQTLPSISEIPISPLTSLHYSPAMWPGSMPHQPTDLEDSGFLIAANQHDQSQAQSLSSSPEVFGNIGEASGKGSSDGASSLSPTTIIHTGTPATDSPNTPEYGGLNTFLSQRNSLSRVHKRSKLCRPRVLKLDDCPPNLRPYCNTDILIPRHECDTMYKKYGDKERCIKCSYDVTPPRRPGLKYEHVSAHINNRPYYCLHCKWGFFRKSNHSKGHDPLWRTTPPSSG